MWRHVIMDKQVLSLLSHGPYQWESTAHWNSLPWINAILDKVYVEKSCPTYFSTWIGSPFNFILEVCSLTENTFLKILFKVLRAMRWHSCVCFIDVFLAWCWRCASLLSHARKACWLFKCPWPAGIELGNLSVKGAKCSAVLIQIV